MKVIIAGDFAPRARLAEQIKLRKFKDIFNDKLVEIIKSADYSLVNFESPIIKKGFKPIKKCGPNLGCTKDAADAIKYAGFTAVTMANNHILDYGIEGLKKSIECCNNNGLDVVGIGSNLSEAGKILFVEKKRKKLAIINCCEHEFSIATETTAGANPLNPIRQYYCIQKAKETADYVLIIIHGGHEHYKLPSPRMQENYRFFIDAGADAVINHHQHCYSGYEIYNGKPIFYGLGNFCFDKVGKLSTLWCEGYFVEIVFDSKIEFTIYPYHQYGKDPTIKLLNRNTFNKDLDNLNNTIKDTELLRKTTETYYENNTKSLEKIFIPINNRYLNYIIYKLIHYIIPNKYRIRLLAYLQCESHIVKVLYRLKNNIK